MSMFVRNGPFVARYKANMYDNIRYQPLSLRLVIIASLSVGQPQNHWYTHTIYFYKLVLLVMNITEITFT